MVKIALNGCYGGFGLSDAATTRVRELKGDEEWSYYDCDRTDPDLIQVIEELGPVAKSRASAPYINEIPQEYFDAEAWEIDEYDGTEGLKLLDSKLGVWKASQAAGDGKLPELQFSGEKFAIVLNGCYGGFGLSDDALERMKKELGVDELYSPQVGDDRTSPKLVALVREMGSEADGKYAKLRVEEHPVEYKEAGAWEISEYDGREGIRLDDDVLLLYQMEHSLTKAARDK